MAPEAGSLTVTRARVSPSRVRLVKQSSRTRRQRPLAAIARDGLNDQAACSHRVGDFQTEGEWIARPTMDRQSQSYLVRCVLQNRPVLPAHQSVHGVVALAYFDRQLKRLAIEVVSTVEKLSSTARPSTAYSRKPRRPRVPGAIVAPCARSDCATRNVRTASGEAPTVRGCSGVPYVLAPMPPSAVRPRVTPELIAVTITAGLDRALKQT